MIHTLRLEASNFLALLAWSIAPRRGISTTYDLPSVTIKRRTRINRQWTTNLRTTIRSFLSRVGQRNIIVSADMALSRLLARTTRVASKLGESVIRIKGTLLPESIPLNRFPPMH